VLFGRIANVPGKLQKMPQLLYSYDDIVLSIKQRMQICQQLAKERLVKFKEMQGQVVKSHDHEFERDDLVLLRVEMRQKLEPLWKGPFEIKEVKRPNAVIQELGKRRLQEVHMNRLKPHFSSITGEKNARH
jgi:hypothetical protein